jgi:hypothetical protein
MESGFWKELEIAEIAERDEFKEAL